MAKTYRAVPNKTLEAYIALHTTIFGPGWFNKNVEYPELDSKWYTRQKVTLVLMDSGMYTNENSALFTRERVLGDDTEAPWITHFSIWNKEQGGYRYDIVQLDAYTLGIENSLELCLGEIKIDQAIIDNLHK